MTQSPTEGPWSRTAIVTNGVQTKDIPGLVVCEHIDFTKPEEIGKLQAMRRDTYRHDEVFGESCNITGYIACPVDTAFEYLSNPWSLEEYTATLREFSYVGAGMYKALDVLSPDTTIFVKTEAYPDSRVIDYLCAWDQGHELWMRYHYRLLDAQVTIGKPGTVLMWNNCKHPYYDRSRPAPDHVAVPRSRTDRMWVGDFWPMFYVAHSIELANIKSILEARFQRAQAR